MLLSLALFIGGFLLFWRHLPPNILRVCAISALGIACSLSVMVLFGTLIVGMTVFSIGVIATIDYYVFRSR